jgi:hypothetical protein
MSACMIDGSIFLGPIDARSVPIFCGNIYLSVVNAGFRPATVAEGIGFSQSGCRWFSNSFFDICGIIGQFTLLACRGLILSAWKLRQLDCCAKAFCMTSTVAIESVPFYIRHKNTLQSCLRDTDAAMCTDSDHWRALPSRAIKIHPPFSWTNKESNCATTILRGIKLVPMLNGTAPGIGTRLVARA